MNCILKFTKDIFKMENENTTLLASCALVYYALCVYCFSRFSPQHPTHEKKKKKKKKKKKEQHGIGTEILNAILSTNRIKIILLFSKCNDITAEIQSNSKTNSTVRLQVCIYVSFDSLFERLSLRSNISSYNKGCS